MPLELKKAPETSDELLAEAKALAAAAQTAISELHSRWPYGRFVLSIELEAAGVGLAPLTVVAPNLSAVSTCRMLVATVGETLARTEQAAKKAGVVGATQMPKLS